MSTSNENVKSNGVGFTSLLLLVFIVLKLCGVIDWSWWWVLSPFWITICIVIIALTILLVVAWLDKK